MAFVYVCSIVAILVDSFHSVQNILQITTIVIDSLDNKNADESMMSIDGSPIAKGVNIRYVITMQEPIRQSNSVAHGVMVMRIVNEGLVQRH